MGRLVNRTYSNPALALDNHADLRDESRHARLLPILFTPVLVTEAELIENLSPAVSQDLSSEGFSMISYGPVETETILAVISDSVESALLHCEVRHARHIGYGYYLRGIRVLEKLRWAPFAKLKAAVEEYNSSYASSE
jgi:hypothetical protein